MDIRDYLELDYEFKDFYDWQELREELVDGELYLDLLSMVEEGQGQDYFPSYYFNIVFRNRIVGNCDLRIGYSQQLFYMGNIGYEIYPKYRENGYATRACKLLSRLAALHRMNYLTISNSLGNQASFRVCEKLDAEHLGLYLLAGQKQEEGPDYEHVFLLRT